MSEFADIQRALDRIEGKQDAMLAQLERGTERMDNQDEKIGALQNRQHWYAGIAAGIGALLGFGGSNLLKP